MIVCSSCGKENQDLYKFCLGCGGDLSGLPSAASRASTAALGGRAAVETAPPVLADMGPMEATNPGTSYPPEPTHAKWSGQNTATAAPAAAPDASSAKTWSDADPPVAPVSPVSWLEQPGASSAGEQSLQDYDPPSANDQSSHERPHDHSTRDYSSNDYSPDDYSSNDQSSNDQSSHDHSAAGEATADDAAPAWSEPPEAAAPDDVTPLPTAPAAVPMVTPAPAGSTRACPTCGASVPSSFAFCGGCGGRVGEIKPAELGGGARASASPQPGVHGRLVLVRPDGSEGGSHPLVDGENLIGRGAGPLFEADGYLSPRHASLVLNAAGLVVRDAGSLNGVFIKLPTEEELLDGDIFRIGQELIRFEAVPPPEPLDDGTEILGSPNPGFWGRLAVVVGRDQDGAAHPLFGDAIILGRERGDIVFPEDGYVSGTHARVSARDGRFWLSDLNSSNGTFLRIHDERPVTSGSFLLMGQQLFRVSYP